VQAERRPLDHRGKVVSDLGIVEAETGEACVEDLRFAVNERDDGGAEGRDELGVPLLTVEAPRALDAARLAAGLAGGEALKEARVAALAGHVLFAALDVLRLPVCRIDRARHCLRFENRPISIKDAAYLLAT